MRRVPCVRDRGKASCATSAAPSTSAHANLVFVSLWDHSAAEEPRRVEISSLVGVDDSVKEAISFAAHGPVVVETSVPLSAATLAQLQEHGVLVVARMEPASVEAVDADDELDAYAKPPYGAPSEEETRRYLETIEGVCDDAEDESEASVES